MQNRTAAIIITVATAVICGCAAILACVFGAMGAAQVPFDITGSSGESLGSAPMPATWGYVLLCLSVLFIAIPVAVGFFTLRKKPGGASSSEPIPPAS